MNKTHIHKMVPLAYKSGFVCHICGYFEEENLSEEEKEKIREQKRLAREWEWRHNK